MDLFEVSFRSAKPMLSSLYFHFHFYQNLSSQFCFFKQSRDSVINFIIVPNLLSSYEFQHEEENFICFCILGKQLTGFFAKNGLWIKDRFTVISLLDLSIPYTSKNMHLSIKFITSLLCSRLPHLSYQSCVNSQFCITCQRVFRLQFSFNKQSYFFITLFQRSTSASLPKLYTFLHHFKKIQSPMIMSHSTAVTFRWFSQLIAILAGVLVSSITSHFLYDKPSSLNLKLVPLYSAFSSLYMFNIIYGIYGYLD